MLPPPYRLSLPCPKVPLDPKLLAPLNFLCASPIGLSHAGGDVSISRSLPVSALMFFSGPGIRVVGRPTVYFFLEPVIIRRTTKQKQSGFFLVQNTPQLALAFFPKCLLPPEKKTKMNDGMTRGHPSRFGFKDSERAPVSSIRRHPVSRFMVAEPPPRNHLEGSGYLHALG